MGDGTPEATVLETLGPIYVTVREDGCGYVTVVLWIGQKDERKTHTQRYRMADGRTETLCLLPGSCLLMG